MLPNFFSSNNLKIFRSARTLKFFRVTWSVTNLAFRNKNQGHRLTRRFRIWSLGWFGPVGQFRLHEFLLPFMAKDKNNLVITVQFCFINIQILKITTLCQPKCACCCTGLKYNHFAPKSYEIARVETVLTFQLIFFFATHSEVKYILNWYLIK